MTRLNPAVHAGPYPIEKHGVDPSRQMTVEQKDSIFLKIFVAAAAVGDVTHFTLPSITVSNKSWKASFARQRTSSWRN
jgi:hypothetical protein